MTTAPANHLASDQGFNDQAEQEAEQDLKANLFPSVIFKQVATVADNLRSQILSYLLSPDPSALGELTAVILTGKVAQKSYGSEKRYRHRMVPPAPHHIKYLDQVPLSSAHGHFGRCSMVEKGKQWDIWAT